VQLSTGNGGQPMTRLLSNRTGDGLIRLPRTTKSGALRDAINQGLVSEDGYLTRKGRNFLAHARHRTSVGE